MSSSFLEHLTSQPSSGVHKPGPKPGSVEVVNGKVVATLRVCASCEWMFKKTHTTQCPRCGFCSYSAHYVYGSKAYQYAKTQKPWREKQLANYQFTLERMVAEIPCCYTSTYTNGWHHDPGCEKQSETL